MADITLFTVFLWLLGVSLTACTSVLAGYLAFIAYQHHRYSHLPSPPRKSFVFGNAIQINELTRTGDEACNSAYVRQHPQLSNKLLFFELAEKWAEEYGDTFVMFVLHRAIVFTRDAKALKLMLLSGDPYLFPKSDAFHAKGFCGGRYLGDGLATESNHDAWYVRRKIVDAVFHRRKLQDAITDFNISADLLIKDLQPYAENGRTFSLMEHFHRVTLDIIMRVMFTMDSEHLHSEFHIMIEQFVRKSFLALEQYNSMILPEYSPFHINYRRNVKHLLEDFRIKAKQVIKEREKLLAKGEAVPDDLLTLLVRSHGDKTSGYTYDVMVDEFTTIVVAGMETSANTLSLLFMELGRRPDLWARLVEEVDEVVGHRSYISSDDISNLNFTQQLIKETLRLYPPAAFIMRRLNSTTQISSYLVPKGTDVMVMISGANRNAAMVDNPMKFDPARFDPGSDCKVPSLAFLTFSLGHRSCIGQIFAQMEMKVVIAKFVQHYRHSLDVSEKFMLGTAATLFPLNRLDCQLHLR